MELLRRHLWGSLVREVWRRTQCRVARSDSFLQLQPSPRGDQSHSINNTAISRLVAVSAGVRVGAVEAEHRAARQTVQAAQQQGSVYLPSQLDVDSVSLQKRWPVYRDLHGETCGDRSGDDGKLLGDLRGGRGSSWRGLQFALQPLE